MKLFQEFVPYELALKLNELGFDEPCLGWYVSKEFGLEIGTVIKDDLIYGSIVAPLWQQAFDWFRKQHNLHSFVHYHSKPAYTSAVYNDINMDWSLDKNISYDTYEDAREKCLIKLIKLCKKN